ncbi:MAG TPA: zf-HC2 domain-containing protein [Pyrinomonadaceae bacterium]|nr:zf-HC2 domain-containing protein [Pyrinomonadaceae bacterium]
MNEKKDATHTSNGTAPRGCGRGEELVAYLYGESDAAESNSFRQHLTSCAACREELSAFGGVRHSVREWRTEVLSGTPALDIREALTTAAVERREPERKRSAVAALREFFSLSPLWLQFGTVTAALVVCALAALTFARTEVSWDANGLAFRTGVPARVVKEQVRVPVQTGYTDEQVNALVNDRVNNQLDGIRAKWEADNNQRVKYLEAALQQQKSASRNATQIARGPRTSMRGNSARSQLADAGTVDPFSTREERGVPHLTDLLDAVNTPQ